MVCYLSLLWFCASDQSKGGGLHKNILTMDNNNDNVVNKFSLNFKLLIIINYCYAEVFKMGRG